jgi:hypothetical protein
MAVRKPAARVSAVRDLLDFVDVFEPGTRAKVLATFPAETLELLETSPRTSWFPIEHDHFVADALIALFGKERAIECWRDSMLHLVDRPLLRTFVSGIVRMLGSDPARVVSMVPKGWPLAFHDFCDVRFERGPEDRVAVVFADVAPQVKRYPCYFHVWHGTMWGFARIAGADAKVDFKVSKDMRSAEARFTWA